MDWGKVCVITRLEKMVENQFVKVWSNLITQGLRKGDSYIIVSDRVAHMAANDAVRGFLKTDCDSAFFLDSDADVGPSFLEELRSIEDGWEFDIFQGFYVRRGWPPEAIWFKRTELGDLMQCLVWKDDFTEETAMAGLHNTLIRREVFEKMLENEPQVKLEDFTWFYYPRHAWQSEDGVFSQNAIDLGFRVGSTTKVKAGHITRVTTGWETYQEVLKHSGTLDMWQNYYGLVEMVANFTGESYDTVIAKSIRGWHNTRPAYEQADPQDADEHRAFFGSSDNGYLYDLIAWNASPQYQKIIEPLKSVKNQSVLVVGAGLGSEVEVLTDNYEVDIFEVPGILRDFIQMRYPNHVVWNYPTLQAMVADDLDVSYNLIVAIDVIEHIHSDEFEQTLDAMLQLLKPYGKLYLHNNFKEHEIMPQAFDHQAAFNSWCEKNNIKQPDGPYGFYEREGEYETIRD